MPRPQIFQPAKHALITDADADHTLEALAKADIERPSEQRAPFLLDGSGEWMSIERIKADPTTALTDKADRHTSSEALEAALYVAYYTEERHYDGRASHRQYYLSEELALRHEGLPGTAPSIPNFDEMGRDACTAWHNSVCERFPYVADYAHVISAPGADLDDYVSDETFEKVSAQHEADARSPRDHSHEL